MPNFNLPFRYAQRSQGTTRDYVFFAAVDPAKGEMRRKRIYIDHIETKQIGRGLVVNAHKFVVRIRPVHILTFYLYSCR